MAAFSLKRQWQTNSRASKARWVVVGVVLSSLLTLYTYSNDGNLVKGMGLNRGSQKFDLDQPPTYEKLNQWEMDLPQHNLSLPFPEGSTGRYVLFKNQAQMLGWNNQLNEV